MHLQFSEFGCIEDLALGQKWRPDRLSAEVMTRVAAMAAGVKPGSHVAIAHSGSARFFADLLATWQLGCTAACIDPALTTNEIQTLVDFVEPSAVLVDEAAPAMRTGAPVIRLADKRSSTHSVPKPPGPHRSALVLFTSGTTGGPKGVVLSFSALLNRVALNREAMGGASKMRTLVTLPTSFGHGLIGNALTPLLSGGDIVLHPRGLELAQNLGRIIDEYRIGFMSSVPSFWRMVLKYSKARHQQIWRASTWDPRLWQPICGRKLPNGPAQRSPCFRRERTLQASLRDHPRLRVS